MIVDDQADALRLVQLRLEKAGMDCVPLKDGKSALEFLEKDQAIDVVILDIMMPMMDGYEVCRRMKATPTVQDIPIVFLTAKLEQSDKIQGLEIGGHDYLTKPVDPQRLRQMIGVLQEPWSEVSGLMLPNSPNLDSL